MNNNIQCSIESSTTKIELNSAVEGVFLVPELEGLAGLPEIRTTSGVNAGYDGGWTSAQNYDARLISIRGVIANPDISKVEDKRRAIASLLGQGRKEQLTLRFTTEAGNAYAISVRTISCEMALQRVLTTQEFLIQLRADDPLIYDDGVTGGIAAILQPQRALGGFEINFGLPLAIGGGAEDTVVDNGNETVYPVIKLYGALHSPTVVNRTTNQQMQILADLQYSIDWHTYRSTTGDYILVNDGLNGAPMTLSQLLGNTEQTTYSGKNLARPNGNNTAAGVSFVWNSDGTITLNGTSTAAIDVWVANGGSGATEFTIPTGTKLTQSFRVVSGSASANTWAIRTNLYYGGASHWSDVVGNTTFTATSETQVRGLEVLAPTSGLTFNNLRLEIQLEKSATATTWERYVGGTPAPNPNYPQPISTVTGAQTVTVTGKNLYNNDLPLDNKYLDASGNWVTSSYSYINQEFSVQPSTAYTWSVTSKTGAPNLRFGEFDASGTFIQRTLITANNQTITTTATTALVKLSADNTDQNRFNECQLELGSTATSYEPYHGQSQVINLGGNLFDRANATENKVLIWATAEYADENKTIISDYISASVGQQFSTNYIAYIFCYNSSKTYLGTIQTGGTTIAQAGGGTFSTFTIPSGYSVAYIRVEFRSSANSNLDMTQQNIMLNYGSTALPYAPYTTYQYELAKIGNYQDRIYKNDGKWYIEKNVGKVVFDGSEAWSGANSNAYYYRTLSDAIILPSSAKMPPVISDYYTPATRDYLWSRQVDYGVGLYDGAIARVSIRNKDCANSDALKTWLSTHPTTVYYALATPTTTEITDETLLLQLNFLASLYKGENNISLVGAGAQGEMVISYATDYTVNQDVITIDSQARTITLNGQDIYHLKTSESEFLVLAPGENKLYLTSEVSDDSGYAEVKFKQGYLSI